MTLLLMTPPPRASPPDDGQQALHHLIPICPHAVGEGQRAVGTHTRDVVPQVAAPQAEQLVQQSPRPLGARQHTPARHRTAGRQAGRSASTHLHGTAGVLAVRPTAQRAGGFSQHTPARHSRHAGSQANSTTSRRFQPAHTCTAQQACWQSGQQHNKQEVSVSINLPHTCHITEQHDMARACEAVAHPFVCPVPPHP